MMKDLKAELPQFCIIMVGVKDEGSRKLSKEVKAYFKQMGSNKINNLGFRQGWAFIGIKGMTKFAEKKGKQVGTGLILGYGKITKRVSKTTKTVRQVAKKVKGGSRIEVQSAGFKDGNFVTIRVAGQELVNKENGKRGLNCVALDPFTHKVIGINSYDTYGDSNASKKFIKDFKRLPASTVLIIGVKDEASR